MCKFSDLGVLKDINNLGTAKGNGDILLALSSVHSVQLTLWSGLVALSSSNYMFLLGFYLRHSLVFSFLLPCYCFLLWCPFLFWTMADLPILWHMKSIRSSLSVSGELRLKEKESREPWSWKGTTQVTTVTSGRAGRLWVTSCGISQNWFFPILFFLMSAQLSIFLPLSSVLIHASSSSV